MPTYKAPVESVLFLLRDVLGYERNSNLPGFADAPLDNWRDRDTRFGVYT